MALPPTSLGLRKPDGTKLAKTGDDDMAFNAQKTDDLFQEDRGRLGAIEAVNVSQGSRLTTAEASIVENRDRMAAVETGYAGTDTRIAGIETTNVTQGAWLANLEASDTAQDEHLAAVDSQYATFSARIGQAEANIAAGAGDTGLGLSEDPDNPGTYFMADTTPAGPLQPDPVTPGLYTF